MGAYISQTSPMHQEQCSSTWKLKPGIHTCASKIILLQQLLDENGPKINAVDQSKITAKLLP